MNTEPKWIYKNKEYYTWDISIGELGGFKYKNSNNEIKIEEIKLNNIGEITKCLETFEYSHINDCIGISETTIDLPNIPICTKFGWDDKAYCWVYFENNKIKPSYFAKKLDIIQ